MPDLGKATYTLELNTTRYDAGLVGAEAKATAATSSIAQKFSMLGKRAAASMSLVGGRMTKVLTVPILAVGIAATTMGYKFEKAMTKIAALVGVGEHQMEQYKDAIMSLVDVVGQGPKELADALYFITSAGFKGASALKILEASAKASAAGLGQTETVADAVTSAVNAYGEANLTASRATDILLAAVREGKAEPEALAASIGRVIAPANLLGVSFDEVGAAIASMSLQGLDAAEATTALRGALLTFARPTVEAVAALKSLGKESGLNTAEAVRAKIANQGLFKTMVELKEAFGDNVEGIANVFGNVRAFVGGQILTGATLQKNEKIFKKLSMAVGDTDRAFKTASETAEFKLDKAMAKIEKSLTILGGTILPMVADAMSAIADKASALGDRFNDLSPETKKLVVIILGIAAAAGPALLLMGAFVGAIAGLIPVIAFIVTPMGALVVAIVALGLAMVAAKYAPEQLAKLLEKLGLSAAQASTVVSALGIAFDVAAAVVKHIVRTMMIAVQLAFQMIGNYIDIVVGLLTGDWGRAWSGIKGLVVDPLNAVKALVSSWAQAIKDIFKSVWDRLREDSLHIVAQIVEPFSHLPGRLGKWARDAKKYVEKELAEIDAKKSAEKVVVDYQSVLTAGMGESGKKGAEKFMLEFHGILDPAMVALAAQAKDSVDSIFNDIEAGVTESISAVNAILGGAAAATAGAQGSEAFWDGKVWRNAQNKVLKQQSLAWDVWNKKTGQSLLARKAPKGRPVVDLTGPSMLDPLPRKPRTGGDDDDDKKKPVPGIIPIDMQIAREAAAQTKATSDDLIQLGIQEDFLRGLISRRNISKAKRLEAMQALTGVVNEINGINEGIANELEKEGDVLVLISPVLERKKAHAENTKWLGDNLQVAQKEKAGLFKLLHRKGLDAAQKQTIILAIIAVNGRIADLNQQIRDGLVTDAPTLWTASMRIKKTKAERTDTLKDDLKVQKDELAYLRKLLKNKHLDLDQRATIMEEITSVMNRIKEINKEVAEASKDANDEMKKLAFNMLGERAGFFATFGSNVFTEMPGVGAQPNRTPGSAPGPVGTAYATGGVVQGTGVGDTVAARLSPGEVVLNKRQIANIAGALGAQKSPESVFAVASTVPSTTALAARPRTVGGGEGVSGKRGPVIEKFENHQHFQAPTPDRNREMRMAEISANSVFEDGNM